MKTTRIRFGRIVSFALVVLGLAALLLVSSRFAQALFFPLAENPASETAKPVTLAVQYDRAHDLVSIHADQISLERVLKEISEKAGLKITSLNEELVRGQVSVEMKRVSLEQAIKELLLDLNSALFYASAPDAHEKTSTRRLVEVLVLSKTAIKSSETRATPDYREATVGAGADTLSGGQTADLLRALKRGGSGVAKKIAGAVRESAEEKQRLVNALLETLNEYLPPSEGVLAALKELALEEAIRILEKRLQQDDYQRRAIAAASLGYLGGERAIEPLVSALNQQGPVTRQVAASSLVRIGGIRAMDALFDSYLAGDNRIKYAVAVAVASHGDAGSQRVLRNLIAAGHAPAGPAAPEERTTNPNLR